MPTLVSPATARLAATIATLAFAATMLLQLLIALGVLPITLAWGGTQTVLTPMLRVAGLAAVAVLLFFAYVIRRRAGLTGPSPIPFWIQLLAWLITAFLALNTLGNFASRSASERIVAGPLSLVLTLACLVVALSRTETPASP
jgi:hypothetical protein